jgi:tetratricopeptide (TPR) repeat protein
LSNFPGSSTSSLNSLLERARRYKENNNFVEANKIYEEVIKLKPYNADAWYNKGVCLGEIGNAEGKTVMIEEALSAIERARYLEPLRIEVWHMKGTLLYILERYYEALDAEETAIKLKPEYTLAWVGKAACLYKLGENEQALESYNEVTNLEPLNPNAWQMKARFLELIGRKEESKLAYRKVQELRYSM